MDTYNRAGVTRFFDEHELFVPKDEVETELAALRAELAASKEIQAAEKKILIEEIGKNATLKAERDALRGAIDKVTPLIKELDSMLNIEKGGNIAENLRSIYTYIIQTLKEAPHEP